MSEHLGYIDSYFNKELSPEECRIFDLRIEQDPAFAEEVAFYLDTLNTAKAELAAQKKERFREIYQEIRPVQRPNLVRKLWPYVAAAAVIIAVIFGVVFYSPATSPLKLADEYIQKNLIELPPNMGTTDSLEMGKKMNNDSNYIEALVIFESMLLRDSTQSEAKKFAGIVCLHLQQYDKSIQYFTLLENTRLEKNPGKFYHAVTLMKRNQPGDKEAAKNLLQSVVDNSLQGKDTAAEWLKKF